MPLKYLLFTFWMTVNAEAVAQILPTPSAPVLLSGLWRGIPVTYQMINAQAIYQGDFLLEHVDPLSVAENAASFRGPLQI